MYSSIRCERDGPGKRRQRAARDAAARCAPLDDVPLHVIAEIGHFFDV
jgi:hypothetical protein